MGAEDYIKRRVDALRDHAPEVYEVSEDVSNEFNTWSALKLILHSAAVNMYTTVHMNQGTGDIFYIDALAGSGVSKYDSDHYFVGSPLVAARAAQKPFSKMYFVEGKEKYKEALEDRLEYAFDLPGYTEPDSLEVIHGDTNEEIGKIIKDIKRIGDYDDRYNYYCFIDNQGLNVNWSSIQTLTPKPYGDLLINLPTTQGIGRNVNQETTDSLNEFFGLNVKEIHTKHNPRDKMKNLYCKRLAERNREVQESTQIQTNIGSYYYDLVYATRNIEDGNGYMNVIKYVKNFVESVHGGDIDRMIDVLDGNQDVIESYLPDDSDESVEEHLPNQSGLSDFI